MLQSVSSMIEREEDTTLFLVDIGVYGFREVLKKYPERAMNIGVFEDGMVGVAAGLALGGIIPTIYAISPFIVERALEQLKLDFVYQGLGGNFITSGAAYDFSKLGYSHYCPEDFGVLKNIPGMEFVCPGTGEEFSTLFAECHRNGNATYYRLSDYPNQVSQEVHFGKAKVIRSGEKGTILVVGTMLDLVLEAVGDEDITILYYTTLAPFDRKTLKENCVSNRIMVCEPHFHGSLDSEILSCLPDISIQIDHVGLPKEIYRNYGTKEEKDFYYQFTEEDIRKKTYMLMEVR